MRDVLTFEHLAFLLKVGVSPSVLMAAIKRARAIGSSADRVLVTEGRITSEALYRALAGHVGVPFVETRFETDPCTPAEAVRSGLVRLVEGAPWRWLIAPEGERLAALVARCGSGMLPGLAITTPARLTAGMLRDRGPRMADFAANRLADANHYPCYRDAPSLTQLVLVLISIPVASYLLTWKFSGTATTALAACGVFLFVAICLRLAAIEASVSGQDPAAPPLQDHELPIYTVLVPLYREASVLPQIVTNLRAIDYPAAKLDIKLLIEAHDGQTRAAAAALNLDAPFEVLVCPPGEPRTKPRALNIGLRFARGSIVVYDAEDRPEPSQLRLAAAAFHHADPSVACLQASLAIYNAEDGWLARMFALEYAVLFDIVLPGFARLNLPMPLGGTSNHFRTAMLERVLGWDPWNVAEDADLGLRFAEEGLCVGVLSSTTFEEAPFWQKPGCSSASGGSRGGCALLCINNFRCLVRNLQAVATASQQSHLGRGTWSGFQRSARRVCKRRLQGSTRTAVDFSKFASCTLVCSNQSHGVAISTAFCFAVVHLLIWDVLVHQLLPSPVRSFQ